MFNTPPHIFCSQYSVNSHKPFLLSALAAIIFYSFSSQNTIAADIGTWTDLATSYESGEREFVLTNNLSASNTFTSDDSSKIDLGGFAISAETPEAEKAQLFFRQSASVVNGTISGFHDGAIVVQGSAMTNQVDVVLRNLRFEENTTTANAGGAFHYVEDTRGQNQVAKNNVRIENSQFYGNAAAFGGAVFIDRSSQSQIVNAHFDGNQANASGGALVFARSNNIVIQDTSFLNNSAEQEGGAIYIGLNTPNEIQFGGGQGLAPSIPFVSQGWDNEYTDDLQISIEAVNKDVLFSGNSAERGSDIFILHGAMSGSTWNPMNRINTTLNIGAAEHRKVQFDGDIAAEGIDPSLFEEPDSFDLHVNPNETQTGEVVFNGKVTASPDPSLYFHRGTLTLGRGDSVAALPLILTAPDAAVRRLNVAQGTIDEYRFDGLQFDARGSYAMDLSLDVALESSSVDTLNWGGVDSSGSTLAVNVSSWNVLNDMAAGVKETEVVVAAEGQTSPAVQFGLLDSGKQAIGALYVYDVTLIDASNGTYRFENVGNADPVNPDDGSSQPSDFNPEVYSATLAQQTVQLLQHEISHRLFDTHSSPTGQASGSLEGGSLNVDIAHFEDIDVDYYVALFEARSLPIALGASTASFGLYGGFVSANTEGNVNNIDSLGGYLGALAELGVGNAFIKTHANIGYLQSDWDSKLKGSNGETDNIWVGIGASAGLQWDIPNTQVTVLPSLDAIYTYVDGDDFTTGHNVDVEVENFNGWEVSPGIRIEHGFNSPQSWRFYAEARYVWTHASNDQKAVHLRDDQGPTADQKLPELRVGDFAETMLGIQKADDNWVVSVGFNGKFGETHGWGLGAAARWMF